jgi:hypothetical protein
MTTATAAQPKPVTTPYLPWKTVDNTISGWKVVLPSRIDRSLLGSYAGTMQALLLSALKYFRLIDTSGVPTDLLRALAVADGPERQTIIAGLVRQGYPFLFQAGFDLTKATPQQLSEKFESTGISGETKTKAISFFTAMAKAGNIELSPFVKTRERRSGTRRTPQKKAALQNIPIVELKPRVQDQTSGQAMRTVTLPVSGGSLTLSGTFNPFDLAGDERALVYAIIDKMNEFAQKNGGKK